MTPRQEVKIITYITATISVVDLTNPIWKIVVVMSAISWAIEAWKEHKAK